MSDYAALMGLPEPTEWQKRVLDEVFSHREGAPWRHVAVDSGRRAWKASAIRRAILLSLARDGHTHVAARDGLWCVTGAGKQLATFGPLWERLATPRHRRPAKVIYDEYDGILESGIMR